MEQSRAVSQTSSALTHPASLLRSPSNTRLLGVFTAGSYTEREVMINRERHLHRFKTYEKYKFLLAGKGFSVLLAVSEFPPSFIRSLIEFLLGPTPEGGASLYLRMQLDLLHLRTLLDQNLSTIRPLKNPHP